MDVEVVAVAPDIVLATLWRDVLSDSGIAAEIVGGGLSSVYPGIAALGGGYQVLVPEPDARRARELLSEAEAEAESEPSPSDLDLEPEQGD